jgi:hypothetical protein
MLGHPFIGSEGSRAARHQRGMGDGGVAP